MACNLASLSKIDGSFEGHRQSRSFKSGSVLKTVLDKDVETTVHK